MSYIGIPEAPAEDNETAAEHNPPNPRPKQSFFPTYIFQKTKSLLTKHSSLVPNNAPIHPTEMSDWAPHIWRTTPLAPTKKHKWQLFSPPLQHLAETSTLDMRSWQGQGQPRQVHMHFLCDTTYGDLDRVRASLRYNGLEMGRTHPFNASYEGGKTGGTFNITSAALPLSAAGWSEEDRVALFGINVVVIVVCFPMFAGAQLLHLDNYLRYQRSYKILPVVVVGLYFPELERKEKHPTLTEHYEGFSSRKRMAKERFSASAYFEIDGSDVAVPVHLVRAALLCALVHVGR